MVSQWDPTKIRARAGKIFLLPNPYSNSNPPGGGTSGGTASFATSVMTLVSVPTSGSIQIGQVVAAAGVAYGTTILSLASGVLGAAGSTYNLSTTPGTIATEALITTTAVSPGGSSGASASFATNVMTLTVAAALGAIALGQTVIAAGVLAGTTILTLASGTLGAVGSTYTLSSTPGTIVAEAVTTINQVVTPATMLQAYLGQFYNDGNLQTSLLPGLNPWAYVDAKGFDFDAKFKAVAFDPALGLPIIAGKYLESAIASCVIGDMSVAKFQDILSTTANETITLAQTTSQALKSGVLLGTTPYNTVYMCLYQWAAIDMYGNPIPGQYDNLFLPRCVIDPDIKVGFTKTKASEISIKITPQNDLWLVSPDSGQYAVGYYQETLHAHS